LIGNDIIDLSLAKTESNWQRRGFLEKQFTANEQQLILAATNSFSLVWRFWSMKEAAYKVFTQQNEMCFFAPKKFDCLLISNKEGMVLYKDRKFYTSSIVTQPLNQSVGVQREKTHETLVCSDCGLPCCDTRIGSGFKRSDQIDTA
jgi:phosphopantetheinyl transferase (holo-ACP synthase)